MARAILARAWPALFWCCFYQHQSSARLRTRRGPKGSSERSSTKFRPKFRLHGQMPHNSRAAPFEAFFKVEIVLSVRMLPFAKEWWQFSSNLPILSVLIEVVSRIAQDCCFLFSKLFCLLKYYYSLVSIVTLLRNACANWAGSHLLVTATSSLVNSITVP